MWKMHLLAQNGILVGLFFNREFRSGPPFGGSQKNTNSFLKCFSDQKNGGAPDSIS
jgi:hypothetical protein